MGQREFKISIKGNKKKIMFFVDIIADYLI